MQTHMYTYILYLGLQMSLVRGRLLHPRSELKRFEETPNINLNLTSKAGFTSTIAVMVCFSPEMIRHWGVSLDNLPFNLPVNRPTQFEGLLNFSSTDLPSEDISALPDCLFDHLTVSEVKK